MRRTRFVVLPVRSWQYMGLMVVSLACLTLGLVSRDREGQAGSLAGPDLQHCAPHEVDACPNDNPLIRLLFYDDVAPHSELPTDRPKKYRNDVSRDSRIASMAPTGSSRASGDLRARSLKRSRAIDHRERLSPLSTSLDRRSISLNSLRTSQGRIESSTELRARARCNNDVRARDSASRNSGIERNTRENGVDRSALRSRVRVSRETSTHTRDVNERRVRISSDDVIRNTDRHSGANPIGNTKYLMSERDISTNNVRSASRNVDDVSRNVRDKNVDRFALRSRIRVSRETSTHARDVNERRVRISSGDVIRNTDRHSDANPIGNTKYLMSERDISTNNVRSASRNVDDVSRNVRNENVDRSSLRSRNQHLRELQSNVHSRNSRNLNERRVESSLGVAIRRKDPQVVLKSKNVDDNKQGEETRTRERFGNSKEHLHKAMSIIRNPEQMIPSADRQKNRISRTIRNARSLNAHDVRSNDNRLLEYRNSGDSRFSQITRTQETVRRDSRHSADHYNERNTGTGSAGSSDSSLAERQESRIARASRNVRSLNARDVGSTDIRFRRSQRKNALLDERNARTRFSEVPRNSRITEHQNNRISHLSRNSRSIDSETMNSQLTTDRLDERNARARLSEEPHNARITERQNTRISHLSGNSRSLNSEIRNSQLTTDRVDERNARTRFFKEPHYSLITERQNNRISRQSRNSRSLDSATRNSQLTTNRLDERDARTRLSGEPRNSRITERQNNRIPRLSRNSRSLDSETRNSRLTTDHLNERDIRTRFSEGSRNARITERQINRISRLSRSSRSRDVRDNLKSEQHIASILSHVANQPNIRFLERDSRDRSLNDASSRSFERDAQTAGQSVRTIDFVDGNENLFLQRRVTDKRISERRDNRLYYSRSRNTNDAENRNNVGRHQSRIMERMQSAEHRGNRLSVRRDERTKKSDTNAGTFNEHNVRDDLKSIRLVAAIRSRITNQRNARSLERHSREASSSSFERDAQTAGQTVRSIDFVDENKNLFLQRRATEKRISERRDNRLSGSLSWIVNDVDSRYNVGRHQSRALRQRSRIRTSKTVLGRQIAGHPTEHRHGRETFLRLTFGRSKINNEREWIDSLRRNDMNVRDALHLRRIQSSNDNERYALDDNHRTSGRFLTINDRLREVRSSRNTQDRVAFNDRRARSDERFSSRSNNLRNSRKSAGKAIQLHEDETSRVSREKERQDRFASGFNRRESSLNERQLSYRDYSSNRINIMREEERTQFRVRKNTRLPKVRRARESSLNERQQSARRTRVADALRVSPLNQEEDRLKLGRKTNTREYEVNRSTRSERRFASFGKPSSEERITRTRYIPKATIFLNGESLTVGKIMRKNAAVQMIRNNLSLELERQSRAVIYNKERAAQNNGREHYGRDKTSTGRQNERAMQNGRFNERQLQHQSRNIQAENRIRDYQRIQQLSSRYDSVRFQRSVREDQTVRVRDVRAALSHHFAVAAVDKVDGVFNRENRLVTAESLRDQLLPASVNEGLRQALIMAFCAIYGASIYSGKGASFGSLLHGVYRFVLQ